jgi:hypothetical protein
MWRRPPGRVFHAFLIPPALGLVWSASAPGGAFDVWAIAALVVLVGAGVWLVRSITFLVAKRRGRSEGLARWIAIAPVAGALVVALSISSAPLHARWALSRSDFEAEAQRLHVTHSPTASVQRDERIGLYHITETDRQGDAIMFYEKSSSEFGHGGFAYLPHGPVDGLSQSWLVEPEFQHLDGPWYAWSSFF